MAESTLNAQKIFDLIEKNNITVAEAAKQCDVSAQTLYNLTKGSDIGANKLVKIADFFHVPLDYLFDRERPTSIGHKVTGNGNSVVGDITLCDCIRELNNKKNEIEHLKALVAEKERTIKILMDTQEFLNRHV